MHKESRIFSIQEPIPTPASKIAEQGKLPASTKKFIDHNDERDYVSLRYEVQDNDKELLEKTIKEAAEKYDISRNYFLAVRNRFPTASLKEILEKLPEYTINEQTSFFREPNLGYLAKKFIPELINERSKKNEPVKILSAGCSTGEEAYSLAFYLEDDGIKEYEIKGIDVSSQAIKKAQTGRFEDGLSFTSGTTFSGIREKDIADGKLIKVAVKEREGLKVFKDEEPPVERYTVLDISPGIKQRVSFERVDLLQQAPPETFDVITINNMLFHFPKAKREIIFRNVLTALRPGGYISLENHNNFFTDFREEYLEWRRHIAKNFGLEDVVFVPQGEEDSEYYKKHPLKGEVFKKPIISKENIIPRERLPEIITSYPNELPDN